MREIRVNSQFTYLIEVLDPRVSTLKITVWHEIFVGLVYFCGLAIFCVCDFLRLGQIGFSSWELILRFLESTQYPALIKCSFFIEYVQ